MLVKKLGFLLMMLLVLVALTQRPASACGCSGDECGCGVAAQECIAECGGVWGCIAACRRENIACSKACCGF